MAVDGKTLAVVIPAFNAADSIGAVIRRIPEYVDWIIVVDDGSTDHLKDTVSGIGDHRLIFLSNGKNLGIGGAMVTGYRKSLEIRADLIAKIDADGQIPPEYLDRFAKIAVYHQCDYVKGNRFGHIRELGTMPKLRLIGSLILTFLTKFTSGYWNVFDPQNGYVMITRAALKRLNLGKIDHSYFFENSMLINLNIFRTRIGEIYLPAYYGEEISHMKISRIIFSFPGKMAKGFLYRMYQKYIFRSVSPVAIFWFFGVIFMGWGGLWGAAAWYESIVTRIPATTGTVILALMPLLFGWALILQAVVLDVQDVGESIIFDYEDESLN